MPARQLSVPAKGVFLLLAARGNPDHGQDPDRPPFGVPDDQLVALDPFTEEGGARLVRAFIGEWDLGSGSWAGGDVWIHGRHAGCFAYNGRLIKDDASAIAWEGIIGP